MPNTRSGSIHWSGDGDAAKKKAPKPMASMSETFAFVFECGCRVRFLFCVGCIFGFLNGLSYPALAYVFSTSFSDVSGASIYGLDGIRRISYLFMVIGVYALYVGVMQTWCFEIVAYHASRNFRLKWFRALLHQDPAFFDVYDIGAVASQVGSSANKYRHSVGRKFGEGIQFLTTGVMGIAFALYSNWKVALVVCAIVPVVAFVSMTVIKLNQTKGSRAAMAYKRAGTVSYSAVSSVKTVLSLNAIQDVVEQYMEATKEAYKIAVRSLVKQGFANGSMMGSFFLFYFILTLYGASLLYKDVERTGCDPSGAIASNETCKNSGPSVFGAMIGIAFSAQAIGQVGTFLENLATGRVAANEALLAIKRTPGTPEEVIHKDESDDNIGSTTHSRKSKASGDLEAGGQDDVRAILPKYEIDSFSEAGLKPKIEGSISLNDVSFAYPTRPNDPVLKGLSVEIEAGKTIAFVGPSGGGKSTIVAMLERFYDPREGSIKIDGINIKDINVTHLRKSIGYVGQEPALFATSIRGNIKYGNPSATQEQIEEAARLANAHDFITSFSDGYDTQVGDKGNQLSGGQKQRIAIARVLVGNPRILLLDEATSALDAESELVVQNALDKIVEKKKITTVIIAHRLSTIRSADVINVIVGGRVVEQGTHDELMASKTYYRKLVEKQDGVDEKEDTEEAPLVHAQSIANLEQALEVTLESMRSEKVPHIEFRSVKFTYPTRPNKKILNNFNLAIEQGSTIALVGPSGGGKSTTASLVERFYDPTEGEIYYLGEDLTNLNVAWYRSQLSYVGQEPVLFNMTIAENIAFGFHGLTRSEIENAAKQANAHDFIIEFPEGYETLIGVKGIQLSGGQKQRVAIARALVRKPKFLILDEATSALDNESESIVQEAIDRLMKSKDHTVLVIAHRLSTIRNANKIALIADGHVLEYGSHDELLEKPDGRYKRLFESSKRTSTLESMGLNKEGTSNEEESDEELDLATKIKIEEAKAFDAKRARQMASPDLGYMFIGSIGALLAGGCFPAMGLLFSATISLLFQPVFECPLPNGAVPPPHLDCESYQDSVADYMRTRSYFVGGLWACVLAASIIGNVITFYGFGTASERLNKRVRDSSFLALMRQEVSFFDMRSVGSITSELQDDAAKIHAFSGEPVRSFIIAVASFATGVVLALVHMWPFALLALACIPIMGAAMSVHMKRMHGEEVNHDEDSDELNSPGGIIVETLLNMRTVAALTMEGRRYGDYKRALTNAEPRYRLTALSWGLTSGLAMFTQQWVNALQFFFGGWLLFKFPEKYDFNDFLIANFSIMFSILGLGTAFQDMSDRKLVQDSAGRIFYLLDRKSQIDPLSPAGIKIEQEKKTS